MQIADEDDDCLVVPTYYHSSSDGWLLNHYSVVTPRSPPTSISKAVPYQIITFVISCVLVVQWRNRHHQLNPLIVLYPLRHYWTPKKQFFSIDSVRSWVVLSILPFKLSAKTSILKPTPRRLFKHTLSLKNNAYNTNRARPTDSQWQNIAMIPSLWSSQPPLSIATIINIITFIIIK